MADLGWQRLGGVADAVVTVVGDHYGRYGRMIPHDCDLVDDLNSDAIDKLEVLMTIEELFGVQFPNDCYASVHTVSDLIELVKTTLAQQNSGLSPDRP